MFYVLLYMHTFTECFFWAVNLFFRVVVGGAIRPRAVPKEPYSGTVLPSLTGTVLRIPIGIPPGLPLDPREIPPASLS